MEKLICMHKNRKNESISMILKNVSPTMSLVCFSVLRWNLYVGDDVGGVGGIGVGIPVGYGVGQSSQLSLHTSNQYYIVNQIHIKFNAFFKQKM